ncbi:MAG TPA: DUF3375 domain-containing protein [Candidatus Xenobia bacterium]|jgi:hypothetical protein
MDHLTLDQLRQRHPAWRLLCSDHAPLIASFLHHVFILPNRRDMSQSDLAEALEDDLYAIRAINGPDAYPRRAVDYLNDWAAPEKGWVRKYYPPDSDEPHFDLTPATEKALAWLASLTERSFVGTESRLLTLFELLRQICEGSTADAQSRLADLEKRRNDLDHEIERVKAGDLPMLDDTAIKDRFQQFVQVGRELLHDFREVEANFRLLDRHVRERIALWNGAKGELLEEVLGERDAISQSDQGRSFRAFWDFLMSSQRQEELTKMLDAVLALSPVSDLAPDPRTRRLHYDWLSAGEHTQRTVAFLSQQLRRFLDDKVWLENRRIMQILHDIEGRAVKVRNDLPKGDFIALPDISPDVDLPMERTLYKPSVKPSVASGGVSDAHEDLDDTALYAHVAVDRVRLARNIRRALHERTPISLGDLCRLYPLEQGMAELVGYLHLGTHGFKTTVDESVTETIEWQSGDGAERQASLPLVTFVR